MECRSSSLLENEEDLEVGDFFLVFPIPQLCYLILFCGIYAEFTLLWIRKYSKSLFLNLSSDVLAENLACKIIVRQVSHDWH